MTVLRLLLTVAFGLPVLATAQDLPRCPVAAESPLVRDLTEDDSSSAIEILADKAEISEVGESVLSGQVEVRQGNRYLVADRIEYDAQSQGFTVSGSVQYTDPELTIKGDSAKFDAGANSALFTNSSFNFPSGPARGSADVLELRPDKTIGLTDVRYTSCPEGNYDWELRAKTVNLDPEAGKGVARHAKIRFHNIPILYLPYLSFPLTDQRKSGFLAPDIGTSERHGTSILAPYYFNLAPQRDATIAPRWMSKRGTQLNGEFRYLMQRSGGIISGQYLRDDDITNSDRYFYNVTHNTDLRNGWRFLADISDASDSQYFEDFRNSADATSITYLEQNIQANYFDDNWLFLVRLQKFVTIDQTIAAINQPYKRSPQLIGRGEWLDQKYSLNYGLTGEYVIFDRDVGITGSRVHVEPEVSASWDRNGFYATPRIAFYHTQYYLDNVLPSEDARPSVTKPIASFDTGLIFERTTGSNRHLIQTLEPRVLYTYIPFSDQTGFPVFDTVSPDFNSVQLFRENRFAGFDRLGDTNQLAAGITTRLLNQATGEEIFRASLGQIAYFSDQRVTLPGMIPSTDDTSDLLAELGFKYSGAWRSTLRYHWDPDESETTRADARLDYRPGDSKILSLGYRYTRDPGDRSDLVDQSDIGFSWPVAARWSLLGRWNYDLENNKSIEALAGVGYRGCCWGVQVVARHHITNQNGDTDQSFVIQFELAGLASVGNPAEEFLERGILGYN